MTMPCQHTFADGSQDCPHQTPAGDDRCLWHRSGLNLSQPYVREVVLAAIEHSDGDMREANLAGCDLSGCDLRGVDFSGAILDNADLSLASLDQARFAGASLRDADFRAVQSTEANFSGAVAERTSFIAPILR